MPSADRDNSLLPFLVGWLLFILPNCSGRDFQYHVEKKWWLNILEEKLSSFHCWEGRYYRFVTLAKLYWGTFLLQSEWFLSWKDLEDLEFCQMFLRFLLGYSSSLIDARFNLKERFLGITFKQCLTQSKVYLYRKIRLHHDLFFPGFR